jgi:hypothetical protein
MKALYYSLFVLLVCSCGLDGQRGPSGAQGPAGATGATGGAGVQGPAGKNGTNGSNGANGSNGTNGQNGTNGMTITSQVNCFALFGAGTDGPADTFDYSVTNYSDGSQTIVCGNNYSETNIVEIPEPDVASSAGGCLIGTYINNIEFHYVSATAYSGLTTTNLYVSGASIPTLPLTCSRSF